MDQRLALPALLEKAGQNGERRKITVKVTTPDAVVRARKEVVYKKMK